MAFSEMSWKYFFQPKQNRVKIGLLNLTFRYFLSTPDEKEALMKKRLMNYETLLKVTGAISQTNEPEEVVLLRVESVTSALDGKG